MGYDEAIKKAEEIISQLEQSDAISLEEYKRQAKEATALLQQCKSFIAEMHEDMSV